MGRRGGAARATGNGRARPSESHRPPLCLVATAFCSAFSLLRCGRDLRVFCRSGASDVRAHCGPFGLWCRSEAFCRSATLQFSDQCVLPFGAFENAVLSVAQAPVWCRRCRDLRTMVSAAGARELGPVCVGIFRPDQGVWMGVPDPGGEERN